MIAKNYDNKKNDASLSQKQVKPEDLENYSVKFSDASAVSAHYSKFRAGMGRLECHSLIFL